MFFQNARDAIKVIKKSFSTSVEIPTTQLNTVVFAFAKELDDLTEKYETLKADHERVSQAWSEINGRYSKLETKFESLYEFMCFNCREMWDEISNEGEENAEQCGHNGETDN